MSVRGAGLGVMKKSLADFGDEAAVPRSIGRLMEWKKFCLEAAVGSSEALSLLTDLVGAVAVPGEVTSTYFIPWSV